jgi:hypothetical protein
MFPVGPEIAAAVRRQLCGDGPLGGSRDDFVALRQELDRISSPHDSPPFARPSSRAQNVDPARYFDPAAILRPATLSSFALHVPSHWQTRQLCALPLAGPQLRAQRARLPGNPPFLPRCETESQQARIGPRPIAVRRLTRSPHATPCFSALFTRRCPTPDFPATLARRRKYRSRALPGRPVGVCRQRAMNDRGG